MRRPNEKGHVETLVGHARRNFLVPVPVLHDGLEGLNARLEADCRADLSRRVRGKPATKAERLAEEHASMLPPPAEAFLAARVEQPTADSLSLVRFDTNDYSLDPRFAGRRVELTIGQREIIAIALDCGELCARHERSFARHLTFTDPAHQAELDRLRGNRRRGPEVDVELRPLSRYDALIPA